MSATEDTTRVSATLNIVNDNTTKETAEKEIHAPQTRQKTGKNKSVTLPTFKKNNKKSVEAPSKGLVLVEDGEGFKTTEGIEETRKNDDINLGSESHNLDKSDTSSLSDFTSQGLLMKSNDRLELLEDVVHRKLKKNLDEVPSDYRQGSSN
ncbi:uncharacterized protein MELLADRAFT_58636 [Melampsora larici-populina 98AG31]|uniref:Uncharacterized protein n=1 Tax=Melampsora larici-populina (strain 98AG31 / pathotype 3-4-7) TaxID=747676 RepID=F4R4A3_MELLP|nr:uncharacterized protein MELLADRAFT_58636 [Melampsora larici-populina 98AG31]EGG12774.1 hypothetical protein MELLADRAFT_58636 [Melampsora larici-populina 98AG31]